jgi:hypothetical protein
LVKAGTAQLEEWVCLTFRKKKENRKSSLSQITEQHSRNQKCLKLIKT